MLTPLNHIPTNRAAWLVALLLLFVSGGPVLLWLNWLVANWLVGFSNAGEHSPAAIVFHLLFPAVNLGFLKARRHWFFWPGSLVFAGLLGTLAFLSGHDAAIARDASPVIAGIVATIVVLLMYAGNTIVVGAFFRPFGVSSRNGKNRTLGVCHAVAEVSRRA